MGATLLTRRMVKRRERNVFNVLRSIYEDSLTVSEMGRLVGADLPVLANLRCGAWYSKDFAGDCYFKSTDGHTYHWDFSFTRINAHVVHLAAKHQGLMLVDSTKSVIKRFPDALSKTVPIWCSVINRAVGLLRSKQKGAQKVVDSSGDARDEMEWDSALHLPPWIPDHEKVAIDPLVEEWASKLLSAQPSLLEDFERVLNKPLRPLWITNESNLSDDSGISQADRASKFEFIPLYLLTASKASKHPRVSAENYIRFSWKYIHGAADDHESWANGLSPQIFWEHHETLLDTDPEFIEGVLEDLVRRVRGRGKAEKWRLDQKVISCGQKKISWIGQLNIGLCSEDCVGDSTSPSTSASLSEVQSILNCSSVRMSDKLSQEQLKAVTLRELKVEPYKYDRHSLQNILPEVVQFARENMKSNKRMLVVCDDGQDISPALVSTVVLYCFAKMKGKINHRTTCADICDFPECSDVKYTKDDIRNAVSCVNQFCPTAHPSRGSIKQVFNYFHRLERINPPSED